VWGDPVIAEDRLKFFAASPAQVGASIDPTQLKHFKTAPPFALFMKEDVWTENSADLTRLYPNGRIRVISRLSGTRLVFEVPN
jgi:hypothetical protein